MDGSALAPIIIPIVAVISLAVWLIMVYYADSHPEWGGRNQASGKGNPGAAAPADRPRPDASLTAPTVPDPVGADRAHQYEKAA
jgi:hypothetical protein